MIYRKKHRLGEHYVLPKELDVSVGFPLVGPDDDQGQPM